MNSGRCHGGPLDGRRLHHPEAAYRLAFNRYTTRAIPAMVEASTSDVEFGAYTFENGKWHWSADRIAVHNQTAQ